MLTPFEKALVAHLIADWLLQNNWMALNKQKVTHPAAWIHGAIHAVLLGIALGWPAGVALGAIHMLIDTRIPINFWQRVYKHAGNGPTSLHVAIWSDQVLHIVCIAVWVALFGG